MAHVKNGSNARIRIGIKIYSHYPGNYINYRSVYILGICSPQNYLIKSEFPKAAELSQVKEVPGSNWKIRKWQLLPLRQAAKELAEL